MIVNFGKKSATDQRANPFGASFKGVGKYLQHDKDHAETSNRVGFSHIMNFSPTEAQTVAEAVRVMAHTSKNAAGIKAAFGGAKTGSKGNGKDVFHFNIDWPTWMKPDPDHMLKATKDCLNAIGLGEDLGYQTFVIEHTDEAHPHVHVVVNLIHPITGKKAYLDGFVGKAMVWRKDYMNAFERDHPDNPKDQASSPASGKKPWDRAEWAAKKAANGNSAGNQVEVDRLRAEFKARGDEISRKGKELYLKQDQAKKKAWDDYQNRKKEIRGRFQSEIDKIVSHKRNKKALPLSRSGIRDWLQTREWKALSRRLYAERRAFRNREKSASGRLSNAVSMAVFAVQSGRYKGSKLSLLFNLVANSNLRETYFLQREAVAKKALSDKHYQQRKIRLDPFRNAMRAELAAAAAGFKTERSLATTANTIRKQQQKDAWAKLSADRTAAWAALRKKSYAAPAAKQAEAQTFESLITDAHKKANATGSSLSPQDARVEARKVREAAAKANARDMFNSAKAESVGKDDFAAAATPSENEPISAREAVRTGQGWKARGKVRKPRSRSKDQEPEVK